ncbi:cytochrome c-type biogenesis protein [Litorivivens sp.]|uniref:cytochrome c-type biogenesis protein n=1 Tax=Litorivivens sp. TaxID=2020868 RepID=UPI0035616BDC
MPRLLLVLCFGLLPLVALAVVEAYPFESDAERRRYNALIDELRCPKCQNQNLAGSDAPIAKDLRAEVYRLIRDGKSDQEILTFMHSRYGDFVLYRPRLTLETVALWLGPLLLVLIGALVWWRLSRGVAKPSDDNESLSEAEQARLKAVLEKRDD